VLFIACSGVAFGTAIMVPAAEPVSRILTAAVILLAAALGREAWLRRQDGEQVSAVQRERLRQQSQDGEALWQGQRLLADKVSALEERLGQLNSSAHERMIAEMRLLQDQLAHLAERRAASQRRPMPVPTSGAGLVDELRVSLEDNRIDLFLQPIVSLPQRKRRYYEAFSHLRTQTGELLPPERYLKVAEDAGLMPTLDNLLLFRCVQLVRRMKPRNRHTGFFVNLSPRTLTDAKYMEQFVEFLSGNVELAEVLFFELGQSTMREYWRSAEAYLEQLADLGFRFSLDRVERLDLDFELLARRRFKFVKVPVSLLLAGAGVPGARIHPADLKEALRRNQIDLIAEKVEDERSVLELLELQVDFGQGFLFGQPRPARESAERPELAVG
jgi:cyclic-di-GMP phosphodiesterase TipF (flagellum assembly factor)